MTPEELDSLAKGLHHEWDSPGLWPRIAKEMAPRWRRWTGVCVAALAAGLAVGIWIAPSSKRVVDGVRAPLLTEQAMAEVASAEAAYKKSIDKLARVAAPKLAEPATPLLRVYAEKLVLLDGAIGTLKREMDRNGFNTDLHLQMAALYRDKQQTLEQVLHAQ